MNEKLDKFHRYLELYQKLIKRNAENFVDKQISEDIVQETFMKMFQHLDYLEDDMVKQWLMVVSGNIAKDYLKKGGKYEMYSMSPELLEGHLDGQYESAEERFEREQKQQAAVDLCRTACNLLYEKNPIWYYIMIDSCLLEMTSEQIGKVLNLSTGNVNVIKSRARSYLRRKLGKEYHDFF